MDAALKRIKNAKLYLIPASSDTRGHATNVFAKFWNTQLRDFLASVPQR
jgi:homoserine O-acetyltransferase